jgi:uncharacterized membrane protein
MIPWDKLHGAMTHFPIALLLFSTACDFVSVTMKKLPFARELRPVGLYALAIAALASLGAVVSGIALAKEGERHDPKEVIEAMVSIVPADTGLFRNVVPKAFEEVIKTNQKEAWENNI